MDELLVSPLWLDRNASLPLPHELYGPPPARRNSQRRRLDRRIHARAAARCAGNDHRSCRCVSSSRIARPKPLASSAAAYRSWTRTPVAERAAALRHAADALEAALPQLLRAAGQGSRQDLGRRRGRGPRGRGLPALLRRRGGAGDAADRAARSDRRKQRTSTDRPRPLGVHQPLEFPAGDLPRPGRRGACDRQHRAGQAGRADARGGFRKPSGCCMPLACLRMQCNCCTDPAKPSARRWSRRPALQGWCFTGSTQVAKIIHRATRGQGRPYRAADRRDRRHQCDGGRLQRAARAGGRCGGAERLPLGRSALLGFAPAC